MSGGSKRKANRILVIAFAILAVVGGTISGSMFKKYETQKVQNVINQQVVLQAQKQAEEKVKLEDQKKQEEKKKLEEQKKLEDQKRQEELKKLEDPVKIKQAINGQGTSNKIPVLMYHSIDYEKGNELRIPKEKFREQMKYLKEEGFNPISLEELYSHMLLGTKVPVKPVVITLDDGYEDNYTNAYPVLKEFGFKAVIFMITGVMDTGSTYLTSDQIKEMDKNGVKIEGHTVNHPKLDTLSYSKQLEELAVSKASLEKLLGRDINYIAYPYGKFNNNTLKAVEEAGYKMAFSTQSGLAQKSNGIYKLHRIYVSDKHNMQQFKQFVNMK
jgi:peptidoglycan/xylan/chitin deacetylase (PgdA/CDA1 family)